MKIFKKKYGFLLFCIVNSALWATKDEEQVLAALKVIGNPSKLTIEQQGTCKALIQIVGCNPSVFHTETITAVHSQCTLKLNPGMVINQIDVGPTGSPTPYKSEKCIGTLQP